MQLREHHSLQRVIEPALTRTCPHCEVFVKLAPQTLPSWQSLQTLKPSRLGIVCVCPACAKPVSLVSGRMRYDDETVDIEPVFESLPPQAERLDVDALPADLHDLADEAAECFTAGRTHAFVLLANRLTTLAAVELGDTGKLAVFNAVTEAATLANMEPALLRLCRHVLFDLQPSDPVPMLTHKQARMLFEVLRDCLHELFARRHQLQAAMPRKQHR
ncbi:MAG: hypothetical protein AAGA84_06105 [Pseudomonadota bacterium]